jgi:hypothetical protein
MSNLDDHTYIRFCNPQNLHKSLNTLKGILNGINIDGEISGSEVSELKSWCNENISHQDKHPYNELIPIIDAAIEDSILDQDEFHDIQWFLDKATSKNTYYDYITSELQVLQGMMHGILADDHVSDDEINMISKWVDDHEELQGTYPYDELNSLLLEILSDRKVTEHERQILHAFFNEFCNLSVSTQIKHIQETPTISGYCAVTPEITFEEKLFCFTGMSVRAKRSELVDVVESLGGMFSKTPNRKLNYLIYGAAGNQCWAFLHQRGFDLKHRHLNDDASPFESLPF